MQSVPDALILKKHVKRRARVETGKSDLSLLTHLSFQPLAAGVEIGGVDTDCKED